jgi:hypothetical protein
MPEATSRNLRLNRDQVAKRPHASEFVHCVNVYHQTLLNHFEPLARYLLAPFRADHAGLRNGLNVL